MKNATVLIIIAVIRLYCTFREHTIGDLQYCEIKFTTNTALFKPSSIFLYIEDSNSQSTPKFTIPPDISPIIDMFQAAEIEKSRVSVLSYSFTAPVNGNDGSTDSLLSLLIPARFRETLWTTVALYVGWRLVSCLR